MNRSLPVSKKFSFTFSFIKAFIPQNIKNKTIFNIYGLLGKYTSFISQKTIVAHAKANREELTNTSLYLFQQKFIENQAEWGKVLFGRGRQSTMAYSGCGIIAVCNALIALGKTISPEQVADLISDFEREGAAVGGKFGVSSKAINEYFVRRSYSTILSVDADANTIEEIEKLCEIVLVTAYNDKQDITAYIHTVCITREQNKGYVLHNAYYREHGQWAPRQVGMCTLYEAITQIGINASPICVIGIQNDSSYPISFDH